MFAVFNSSKENYKSIAKENETQLLRTIIFSVPFSVYF